MPVVTTETEQPILQKDLAQVVVSPTAGYLAVEVTMGTDGELRFYSAPGGGGGLSDGDKGDITVSSSGAVWTIDAGAVTTTKIVDEAVTLAKMAGLATDRLIGRATAGTGAPEAITCTAAGRALIDDVDAIAQRTTLGLGTIATQNGTFSGTSSGTNTGDQTITLTGEVTGSGTGSFAATITNEAVTFAKMAPLATDRLIGRATAGAGAPEAITCTAAGRALLDDASAAVQRTTLGLGSAATSATGDFAASGDATASGLTCADLRFLGRDDTGGGPGPLTELRVAAGLELTAGEIRVPSVAGPALMGVVSGTATPSGLTPTQSTAMLNLFTTAIKGLVPASGGGTANFLRADGTWAAPAGGGGGASATTVEVNVSATPKWTGSFTITDAAITATSKVMCWQAPGPYTGKGTLPGDEILDRVEVVSVVPAAGSAKVTWQTPAVIATREVVGTCGGPKPVVQTVFGVAQVPEQMSRRNLVKGNIKFHYLTFA